MEYTFVDQEEAPPVEKGYTFVEEGPEKNSGGALDDFFKYGSSDEAIIAHQEDVSRVAAYIPTAKKVYKMADKQIEIGRLGNKWMENKASPDEIDRIRTLNQEINFIQKDIKSKPYEARAAAQLVPYMKNAISKGGKNYLIGSTVGMITAGTVGMAIPGAEEALTIPAAAHAMGSAFATFGVAEDMRKIEGGNAYIQLIQSGVEPNIAKWAGRSYGLVSAGLEMSQLKILSKLFPGAKNVAPKIIKKAIEKVVNKKIVESSIAKAMGKQAFVATGEATVEATQQFFENLIGTAAKEYQDYAKDTDVSPEGAVEQWNAIKNGIAETFAQTFVGVGILGIPSVGVNFVHDTVAGKREYARQQDLKNRIIESQEEGTVVTPEKIVEKPTPVTKEEEVAIEPEVIKEEITAPIKDGKFVFGEEKETPNIKTESEVVTTKPIKKETRKVQAQKQKKVKFNQNDLTQPAIRMSDGTVYEGTKFSDSWSVSKPDVAIKEGPKALSVAREKARSDGKKIQDENGNVFYEQGFIVDKQFVSTDTIAKKFNVVEKVAKKKAARIAEQGIKELAVIEKEKQNATFYKEKLKKIRKPTEQDIKVVEDLQPIIKKVVRSFTKTSPALSSLFSSDELVNVGNESMLNYVLKTHPSDIDAYINGKDVSKIKGSSYKAATFGIKNHVKKQLGSKVGKSRRKIAQELEQRIFRDTIAYEEGKRSSIAEGEEAAIEEAHFEGREAPRAGKSAKDKYLGKVKTDAEMEAEVKATAGPVKKISVKEYLKQKAQEQKRTEEEVRRKQKEGEEKFKSHKPTKISINKSKTIHTSPVITMLNNERGETTVLGDAAKTLIDGYDKTFKKIADAAHDFVDVQAYWNRVNLPKIGLAVKNIFSIQTIEQQKGLDISKEFIKIVKKSHKGYKITRRDLGEITLAAEDPAYLKAMGETKRKRIEPGAKFLAKYFKDSQKELSNKGIQVDFTKRMLGELNYRLKKLDKTKDTDGKKEQKIKEQIKIIKRIQFVHIPIQMWTLGRTKELINARNEKQYKKKLAELKLALTHKRQAVSLGSLVERNVIGVDKINPVEIILNYSNKKGKDFALTNIRDAAVAEGMIKHQKTKPKKGNVDWVKIPNRLSALSIDGKPQGWIAVKLRNTIDDTISSVEMQSKFDKTIAVTKMAAFYNPLFLPSYDVVQFFMLGPVHVHQIPGVVAKAIKDIVLRTDNYYLAERWGTFSKPFALPFSKWKSTAKKLTGKTTAGWYASQFSGLIEQTLDVKHGSLLKPLYELSWTTAWKLDEVVRMMSFNYLIKQGHSPKSAAQTAAKFHGDYAGVPAKTRKALNRFLFTPTFKLAMGGLWFHMLKNVVTTVGGLRKKGTTKMQRRLAYGAMSTLAINMAFHLVMVYALGFDDDQWGRRYVKRIHTKDGVKEVVITWSSPANIFLKYIYRINEAIKPGVPNPLLSLWDTNMWELHPLYRATIGVVTNTRAGGEEVYNEQDNTSTKLIKSLDYFLESIVGMYSGIKMMTSKHGSTYSVRQARKKLIHDYGLAWKLFFQHFMFAYTRDVKEKRKGGKTQAMMRRLNRSIKKSMRETKTFDKTWVDNAMKKAKEILKN